MIARIATVLVVTAGMMVIASAPVHSAECSTSSAADIQGSSTLTGILISGELASANASCGSASGTASPVALPQRDSDLDAICVREALGRDVDPFGYCDLDPGDAETIEVTPGQVAAVFRRLPLPAADLAIQPPNGRTLVNFETNFYTEQGEFTRTVRLLGRQVELRIWPERFGWRFGDGHERWTTSPGDAYPNLEVTHRYLSKGRVAPSVATTYAAQFRVGNGPWRDVSGTVTIPGASQSLRVVEARPVLVGGS